MKISTFRTINEKDYGKIKYIRKNYPYLKINDIAMFLQVSSHSLSDLFSHPMVGYRKAGMDETIELEVYKYAESLYPEYLPSVVKIIKSKVMHLA